MTDGRDRVIERVAETLRSAPEAAPDPRAVARLLSTVWESPPPSLARRWMDALRMPKLSGLGASALAALAVLAGFVTRGAIGERPAPAPLAATGEFPVPVLPATALTGENAPVLTQFVLDRPDAQSVSLVGGFNEWQGGVTPLVRLESGVWTVSVPLPPGRHVYAFLVDGTFLTADPRAPKSGDADYGQEGSVVMVFAR